jgi:pimeloyl-ACP methyl ester carboxylesterase
MTTAKMIHKMIRLTLLVIALLAPPAARAEWHGGIGVLGDSYSDEYPFSPSQSGPRKGTSESAGPGIAHVSAERASSGARVGGTTERDPSANGRHPDVEARTPRAIPAARDDAGALSLVRPYARGKVPVVLIHGLGSTPRSWAPMIAGLEADPILREHYQFWTFGYPTGEPVLYSASVLRRALLQAREQYDPDGSDPAFDRMVVIGHSLGGLLAKLMVQDSGSHLWKTVSARPADRLDGPAEAREVLRQAFFFKPLPEVRRVIFIATPHRGSRLDRGAVHAFGTRLFRHADPLQRAYETLLASNGPDFFLDSFRGGLPTSVDQLKWDHPRLLSLRDLGIDPGVDYHSIIADLHDPPREGGTDGVVPYASAHLDGAASELLIHGGHLCQAHPLVIEECRRILTEQLVRIVRRPDGSRASAFAESDRPEAGEGAGRAVPGREVAWDRGGDVRLAGAFLPQGN